MENPNSDRQSMPDDSNPSSNTTRSEHEEIALLFRMATDKLDRVEANAKKEKQQIVRDLARELQKFRPIDRIASEIVEELREKVSKSVVYAALDERYKTSYRVRNARKRRKEREKKADSLAPTSELKPLIVDRTGHSTQQLVSEPYLSDDADDKPANINEKQNIGSRNGGNTDTKASPPVTREATECEHCQLKDSRIKELEDIVRKTTQLTPANQIAVGEEEKTKQLQKELDERTRENAKLSDEVKHFRELQTEVHKDENHNIANIAVTNDGHFEFSLLLGDIKYHLAALYPRIGDAGKVWFSGKLDKDTGNILSIRFGRIGEDV